MFASVSTACNSPGTQKAPAAMKPVEAGKPQLELVLHSVILNTQC